MVLKYPQLIIDYNRWEKIWTIYYFVVNFFNAKVIADLLLPLITPYFELHRLMCLEIQSLKTLRSNLELGSLQANLTW